MAATPRKIAYLLSQYPAVSHTFFLNEIAALRERGYTIETVSINGVMPPVDGFAARELTESGRTFYVKAMPRLRALLRLLALALRHPLVVQRGVRTALGLAPGNVPATLYALFYLAEALLVGAWMRETGCNHLHVHFAGPVATVALLASSAWRLPYSMTVHGPDEFYDVETFYLRRKVEQAAFVTCISHFCRSQLLRLTSPAMAGKMHVCPLGVDASFFVPAARAPAPHNDEAPARLMCVGRLHPSKGQTVLLAAVGNLIAQGYRVSLDLVGGGENRAEIEQRVAESGLSGIVTMHGATSHERTRALLAGADVFVLASFAEGVPVALMEAMAMEIACVSTFVGGIPELIRPGVDGLLVAPSSIHALAEAIASLLDDPERRRALAVAGRARVLASYNLATNADRLAEIFSECGLARSGEPYRPSEEA